jgi:serine protease AprX
MKQTARIYLCLLLWAGVATAAQIGGSDRQAVWVLLVGKAQDTGARIPWHQTGHSPTSRELGLPVDPEALVDLREAGLEIRFVSRWLNAVSVMATADQIAWLKRQPTVHRVQPVARYESPRPDSAEPVRPAPKALSGSEAGVALQQLDQIRVLELHARGVDGSGVRVALLDNGFHTQHVAFAQTSILATWDFINADATVSDEIDEPVTGDETASMQNIHGAQVLSVLGGFHPGRYVGVAPGAEFLLAKTEDNGDEMPIEEDRWVAGLEWADSLGAQIVSSSLGYNLWDDGSGYTHDQLDGSTALTSQAAAAAVQRGLAVVVAAGNEGANSWRRITAPADADGVIAVGSVDVPEPGSRPPGLAASSSRGPTSDGRIKPDLVAPGQGVIAADIRGGDYIHVNGTSFATPMVAGVCALLLQAHPEWGPDQVLHALRSTALDLGQSGPDNDYGWGQVDAYAASGLSQQAPVAASVAAPFPNPVTGDVVHFPLEIATRGNIHLSVFSVAGELVYSAAWYMIPGSYKSPEAAPVWDIGATEAQFGDHLGNGVLLYRLQGDSLYRTGRIALARDPERVR